MTASALHADLFLAVESRRSGKIKGECRDEGHADEIALSGWYWGVAASSAAGSGARTARRQYRPLVVTKFVDASSALLLNALATNDEITRAALTMRKAGGEALDSFKLVLTGARVVDVDFVVDESAHTLERVSFTFTGVEVDYQAQGDDGISGGSFSFSDEIFPAE